MENTNQNHNNENSGCGIAAIFAKIGVVLAMLGGDALQMCSRSARFIDDVPTSTWTHSIDDIPTSTWTHSIDDIPTNTWTRQSDEIFGENGKFFDQYRNGEIDIDELAKQLQKNRHGTIFPEEKIISNLDEGAESRRVVQEEADEFGETTTKTNKIESSDDILKNIDEPIEAAERIRREQSVDEIVQLDNELLGDRTNEIRYIVNKYSFQHRTNYEELLVDIFTKYLDDLKSLKIEFGDESIFFKNFEEGFFTVNKKDFKIEKLHANAFNNILPKEVTNLNDDILNNDIIALLVGKKLNSSQAKLLSRMTRRKIKASTNRFDNYLFVKPTGENKIIVNSTNSFNKVAKDNLISVLSKAKKGKFKVIFEGDLTDEMAFQLSRSNIKFIKNVNQTVADISAKPKNFELILVASKKKKKLAKLFGISRKQAKKMTPKIEKFGKMQNTSLVEDEMTLRIAIENAENAGKEPVVIFNNIDNKLFDKTVSELQIKNPITCKSYGLEGSHLGFKSTDFIYVEDVLESFSKIHKAKPMTKDELLYKFTIEYDLKLAKRRNLQVTVGVGIGVSTGGAVGYTIYYNNNKND